MHPDFDNGYYSILTHDVLFHPELSDKAKLLYAALTGLARSKGYAWPTDEYLAGLFGWHEDNVKVWLKDLETHGFIERETYNEGFHRKRKIWIARDKFKKVIQRGEITPIDRGEITPSEGGESTPISIYNNIKEKNNPPTPQRGKEQGGGVAYADPGIRASTEARLRKIDPEEFDFLQGAPLAEMLTPEEKMQLMRYPPEKVREAVGWALEQKNTRTLMGRIVNGIQNEKKPKKAGSMPISKADIQAWVDWLNQNMEKAKKKERYSIEGKEFNMYLYDYDDVITEKGCRVITVPYKISVHDLYNAETRKTIEDHMFMIIGRPRAS